MQISGLKLENFINKVFHLFKCLYLSYNYFHGHPQEIFQRGEKINFQGNKNFREEKNVKKLNFYECETAPKLLILEINA